MERKNTVNRLAYTIRDTIALVYLILICYLYFIAKQLLEV